MLFQTITNEVVKLAQFKKLTQANWKAQTL